MTALKKLSSSGSTANSYGPNLVKGDTGVMDQFPAGLRVLVVDDDIPCLRIVEQMLRRCNYLVTPCYQATVALNLLRERKGCFDLVLSDVHMPDMDGFKLLELVGLEMDLPVIMMSADGRTSAVMRGIKHGACDYLLKPIREEALKNIWQHVLRKKLDEAKENENSGSLDDNEQYKQGNDDAEYASSVNEGSEGIIKTQKKRRDVKEEDDGETENDDPTQPKRPRVVWSVELHQQFVSAVNQLGIDKAVPKRILELMNVSGLTRENVASHLQKFRLYLKRLSGVAQQHGGMSNPFCGPVEQNPKLGSLGRLNFQALAAAGQIPPQTLAALQAELLGQPTGLMSTMDQSMLLQSSLQGQTSVPVDHVTVYGQPLMKCSSNISSQFSQSIIFPEEVHSEVAQVSNSLGAVGPNGVTAQNGNMLIGILQNQQHKQSNLQESTHSINVQPSCLVAPSKAPSFQAGNSPASADQSCGFNRSSVIDYSLLASQLNNSSIDFGQRSDGNIKTTGVLNGYSALGSISPSVSSCSANAEAGAGERFQNSAPAYSAGRQFASLVPTVNDIERSYSGKSSQVVDHVSLRNLGFVGKGTSIPSRFAVEEPESPMSNFSYGNIYMENDGKKVKQEPYLDFIQNAKTGNNRMLQHFSPNDLMSVFSE